jgi:acyl dehydratase
MRFFEDMRVGDRAEIGRHTFTIEEIKSFAQRFDPQPFHLDETAAAQSLFGALCASGWHTACMWMRLAVESRRREDDERRARGEPVAALGVSPGFRELRWLSPVYPGDTVTYATEIVELRPSASRPEWGIMTSRNTGTNQRGEPVLSFLSSAFVERKPWQAEPT